MAQETQETASGRLESEASETVSERERLRRERRAKEPKMMAVFTCNRCETREQYIFSKTSYERGIVIVRCPGCENLHLVADNLGWFRDQPTNIEDLAREKGELSSRIDPSIINGLVDMYQTQHHQHTEACQHHDHDHQHTEACQHHDHDHHDCCHHHHHGEDGEEMQEGDHPVMTFEDLEDEEGKILIKDAVGNDVEIYQDAQTLEFSLDKQP